jgi:hypothetical protein
MMRPNDLSWSDIGPWPSTSDDPVKVTCTGCGLRGGRSLFAQGACCWSCWADRCRRQSRTHRLAGPAGGET